MSALAFMKSAFNLCFTNDDLLIGIVSNLLLISTIFVTEL
jgi:hypothetical protein